MKFILRYMDRDDLPVFHPSNPTGMVFAVYTQSWMKFCATSFLNEQEHGWRTSKQLGYQKLFGQFHGTFCFYSNHDVILYRYTERVEVENYNQQSIAISNELKKTVMAVCRAAQRTTMKDLDL